MHKHQLANKHTANAVKAYLDRRTHNGTLSVMDYPTEIADLNIVQAVWVKEQTSGNIERRALNDCQKVWKTIPEEYLKK